MTKVSSHLQDPEGKPKNATIQDNRDGTYTVSYVPDPTGPYTITIKYGGDEIPYSPYCIQSLPTGDASKCLLTGKKTTVDPSTQLQCFIVVICVYCHMNMYYYTLFHSSVDWRTWRV